MATPAFPPMATPTLSMATAKTPPLSPPPPGDAPPGAAAWKYAHNLKVLRRRDPSIQSIFDQFSHVCVYTHDGARWTKQGVEGSMFLFERAAYPPYGLYILNRTGTADFIQPVLPELSLQAHDKYLLLRTYPAFTAARLAAVPPPQGPGSKFAREYAVPGVERLSDAQKGEGVTIGLWCFATDARESMQDVVMRLHGFVQRNEPYPAAYKYLPDRPAPNTHKPSPSLDALFSKLAPVGALVPPAPDGGALAAPRGQALLDSIFASAATPALTHAEATRYYEGDNEDSDVTSDAPSPAPVYAQAQTPAAYSAHTPAHERTPRAPASALIDEDALDALPAPAPAAKRRNRRKEKEKQREDRVRAGEVEPAPEPAPAPSPRLSSAPAPPTPSTNAHAAPLQPAHNAHTQRTADAAAAGASLALGGSMAFTPAPDPWSAPAAEDDVPELDFGDAAAMQSLASLTPVPASARAGKKKEKARKKAGGGSGSGATVDGDGVLVEAMSPPAPAQVQIQIQPRPQVQLPKAAAPQPQTRAPPSQAQAPAPQPQTRAPPPQAQAQAQVEGVIDPARARTAILASLPVTMGTGMGRNDFVREVLTLIHRDKAFVDTLWAEYSTRG